MKHVLFIIIILNGVMYSCKRDTALTSETGSELKKQEVNTCTKPDYVLFTVTFPKTLDNNAHKQMVQTVGDVLRNKYPGQGYIKRTADYQMGTVTLSAIQFGYGTPVVDQIPDPDKTVYSGTDWFAAMHQYHMHVYFADRPCQEEAVIFEYEGVWYVEDCC